MDKKKKDWVSVWVDAIGEMGEISSSGNYSCYVVSLNLGHFRSMVEKSDISARNNLQEIRKRFWICWMK